MDLGRTLMVIGAVMLGVGLVLTLIGGVLPLGRLPGDITVQGDRWTAYAPIATAIVLSIALTLALNLVSWLQNR
ncbi:MAG TPA: DUF2905 domain-containing protein [Candidatus Limnocylindria bacterium]